VDWWAAWQEGEQVRQPAQHLQLTAAPEPYLNFGINAATASILAKLHVAPRQTQFDQHKQLLCVIRQISGELTGK
jgi:hypothetical protein